MRHVLRSMHDDAAVSRSRRVSMFTLLASSFLYNKQPESTVSYHRVYIMYLIHLPCQSKGQSVH